MPSPDGIGLHGRFCISSVAHRLQNVEAEETFDALRAILNSLRVQLPRNDSRPDTVAEVAETPTPFQ